MKRQTIACVLLLLTNFVAGCGSSDDINAACADLRVALDSSGGDDGSGEWSADRAVAGYGRVHSALRELRSQVSNKDDKLAIADAETAMFDSQRLLLGQDAGRSPDEVLDEVEASISPIKLICEDAWQ